MLAYASLSSARLGWETVHGEESIRKYLVNALMRLRLLMMARSMLPRARARSSSASGL